jgi:putative nucleotidyltransferase with HDIG domain
MDSERLFTLLTQRIMEVLQARIGYILLLDRDSWSLTIGASAGIPGTVDKQMRIPLKPGGVSHWVIKNRQPLLIGNINSSSDFNRNSYLGYTRETVICTPLTSGDEIVGTMTIANHKDGNAFTSEDLELTSTIAAQASIAIKNALLYKDLQSTYLNTVQALISAVEANDTYTHGHSDRVRYYALRLAEYMGLPNETIKNLEQAAILHDIGKIGICESLLNKKEPLCREEIETLRQHPVIGARILQPIRFLEPIREIIHQHHERHDGYGYPKGLQGEQTLLEARILAIADTYDAMTSDRPYRAALSHEATIAEIRQHTGSQFDPVIAAAFLRMVEQDQLAG